MKLISWSYYATGSHLARHKARAEPLPHEKRKVMNPTDPPGSSTGTPRQEGAHHTKLVGRSYATGKFRATQNCLESSSDPRIKDYLRFLSRELIYSDDPIELRAFLSAHYSYNKFQRLGTPGLSALRLACNSACVPPVG